ncbi:interferon-induced very large GTPase 1-like [Mya arenaria]|uniref:interferon-induced very large GTPase 1-like n=1 Tax=Mya arenaria TaxID=6604 RepID=UPI0022E7BA1C|nr:interferon-induced very large GTPase 1-like [Mya arenaria]
MASSELCPSPRHDIWKHFYDAAPQTTEEGGSISRLDIFWTLFHCCDPFLKQIIVRKLYICNLAVPFLSKDYRSNLVKAFIWPLRHLSLSFDESSTFSEHAFDISTHVVAFGRLGRPTLSKSCILNEILSDEKTKTKFPVFYDTHASHNMKRGLETAHICDSFIYLTEDTEQINLPSLEKITNPYADLVIQGQVHLELIDSDKFYMPTLWIRNVLASINAKLINSKLITVSVLGLQSSGKSTLLNTMFGVHFSVSSGRCTRGIYAQLLPVRCKFTGISPFNYLMVVDSEGLRSSDLLTVLYSYNRDNEMATFVTGLGNISIMNIMGEHISDLKDILQIVINALLRLYEANNALPKDQRCFLVHHNVSEHARFVECLDVVTEEAAIQEGSLSKRFTDVIQFDHDSSVQYIPCLWQGVYHLKHVNTEYSSAIIKLKHCLMNSAMNIDSGKSFTDFGIQAVDLWKGVISENFVFSFRNRLEIKAYCTIFEQINRALWREEMSVRKKVLTCSQGSLSQCKLETNVEDERNKLRYETSNAIEQFTESALTMCEKFLATKLAKTLRKKGNGIDRKTIDSSFNKIWKRYKNENVCDKIDFHELTKLHVLEKFKNDIKILQKVIKHTTEPTTLRNSFASSPFCRTDINTDEPNEAKQIILFQELEVNVNCFLQKVEEMIQDICTETKELLTVDFMSFLQNVCDLFQELTSKVRNITLKKIFHIKLDVHILNFASCAFKNHNEFYDNQFGMTAHMNRYKSELYILFQEDVVNRTAEHRAAELFCLGVCNSFKKNVSGHLRLKTEEHLKGSLPFTKHNLIKAICTTLANNNKLDQFVEYLRNPKLFAKGWMKHQCEDNLNISKLAIEQARHEVLHMTSAVENGVKLCCAKFKEMQSVNMSEWSSMIMTYLQHSGTSLDHVDFQTFCNLRYIQDIEFFTNIVLGQNDEEGLLKHKTSLVLIEIEEMFSKVNISYSKILNEMWGCNEQCPFCLEPCAKSEEHGSSPHYCIQHRPNGCVGLRFVSDEKISKETCNASIALNFQYMCSVIKNACGCKKQVGHPYREYKQHFPKWEISPSSNSLECAKFWLWFVGSHKDELAKYYGYDVSEVPTSWGTIKKSAAIRSLSDIY